MMHAAPFVCIRRTFLRKVVSGISILAFRHLGAYTLCLLPSPSSTFFLSAMDRAALNRPPRVLNTCNGRLPNQFSQTLLRGPALVIKSHHRPARQGQVSHNESDSREQLPRMMLDLRHHPPGHVPTPSLVEEPFVLDHRLLAGPARRAG